MYSERLLKIVVIGSKNIGKTWLSRYLTGYEAESYYEPTIGVDYLVKFYDNGIKFVIWDLGGHPRFEEITKPYIGSGKILLFTYCSYDLTSFKHMKELYYKYRDEGKILNKHHIIVVGTRSDERKQEELLTNLGQDFCIENHFDFYEISTKKRTHIDDLMNRLFDLSPSYKLLEEPSSQYKSRFSRCCLL